MVRYILIVITSCDYVLCLWQRWTVDTSCSCVDRSAGDVQFFLSPQHRAVYCIITT